jgi:HEAT repeat protein
VSGRHLLGTLSVLAAFVVPSALWELGVRAAVDRAVERLGDRDEAVRSAAAARLTAMGPVVVPRLVQGFAVDGDVAPRPAGALDGVSPMTVPLMNLLRDVEDPEVIAHLLDAMRHEDENVRHYAGLTLAYIGTDAVPALVRTLRTAPDARGRTSAAWVLSFMGAAGREAIPALREALQDAHKDVRYTARYALEQLSDEGGPLWQAVDRARAEPPR